MDKVLDRFGVYDLVGVFLSGATILILTSISDRIVFESWLWPNISFLIENSFYFAIISYFLGLLFQEIGSFVFKHYTNKNDKLLKRCISRNIQSYQNDKETHYSETLTEYESEFFHRIISIRISESGKHLSTLTHEKDAFPLITEKPNDLYNYCKFYLKKLKDNEQIDKDHSISAMSRSLGIYLFLLSFITLWKGLTLLNYTTCFIALSEVIVGFLIFNRAKRFLMIRYTRIIRGCIYSILLSEIDHENNSKTTT